MNNMILEEFHFVERQPFEHKVWLSSPTMHGEELAFVTEASETNWVSTVGQNINELEKYGDQADLRVQEGQNDFLDTLGLTHNTE